MKTQVDRSQFHDTFKAFNRQNNFTYEALDALFDYYEEYEDSTGEEVEFDCIAICCDWSEDSPKSIIDNYSLAIDEDLDEDEVQTAVMEYLSYQTSAISLDSGDILYIAF